MANIRTFKNIQDECLAWLDEAGDTDVTLTLVKQAIRAAHELRLTTERWPFMLWPAIQFSTTTSQFYALHPDCARLYYLKNLTIGQWLTEYNESNIRAGENPNTDTDDAIQFQLGAISEVQTQPAITGVLTLASSAPSDNGTSTVTVTGDTASGVQSETIISGSSGAIQFRAPILKISKSSSWAGTLTLSSSGTTLLTLLSTELGRSYPQVQLLATPPAGQLLEYRFYRQPSALVHDNDRPDLPPPFESILTWDTLLDMANYNTFDPSMVKFWQMRRDALLLNMQNALNNPQTIGRAASYTDFIPRG